VNPPPRELAALIRSATRSYGVRGIIRRATYEIDRRSGLLVARERHVPRHGPPLQRTLVVDASGVSLRADDDRAGCAVAAADELLAGNLALYGGAVSSIGWPPRWHVDPTTGRTLPGDVHWSTLSDASMGIDVKDPWEVGRMGWLATCARALVIADDDRAAESMWEAIEDFALENPPFLGIHWMSGQEVALRGIALLFAGGVLERHASTTEHRRSTIDDLVATSVARVRMTLGYAASQRNNHYLIEAAFLWSAAAACPGLPRRRHIERIAGRALREAVADQFGDDGSYAQHSFTYQRLALHALLWVRFVGERTGRPLPCDFGSTFAKSVCLLGSLIDENSGRLPNLGSNDGALLFRLTDCPIGDFRPLLAHAAAASGMQSPLPAGRWDEEAQWFGLQPSTSDRFAAPHPPAGPSAYHVFQGRASRAMLRAGPLRHRLSHADQLHLDVWIGGQNVAMDLGTYRYTAPSPWQNSLAADVVHNVPLPSGAPQARRHGRFFWLDWPEPTVVVRFEDDDTHVVIVELAMPNAPSVTVRRLVAQHDDRYVVADLLRPPAGSVRWNLPDGTAFTRIGDLLTAEGDGFIGQFFGNEATAYRAGPSSRDDPTSGWASPTYATLEPVAVVQVGCAKDGTAVAMFAPPGESILDASDVQRWRSAIVAGTSEAAMHAVQRLGGQNPLE